MQLRLPEISSFEQFEKLDTREPAFLNAAQEICKKENIQTSLFEFAKSGSLPVVMIGSTHVLKFFPSIFADEFKNESDALFMLNLHHISVPKIYQTESIQSWYYILMSRLPGQSLKKIWPELNLAEKQQYTYIIGQHLKRLHDISIENKESLKRWSDFITTQKKNCSAQQEKKKLSDHWLKQIPDFLENIELSWDRLSFLHTEVMSDHVFFEKGQFSGFIDFEPSTIGAPEYDFASVGLFVTGGDSLALRSFFSGYGNLELAQQKNFRRRIMAYTLLHRYSNLNWYLQFMPKADRLEELADLWWGVG